MRMAYPTIVLCKGEMRLVLDARELPGLIE